MSPQSHAGRSVLPGVGFSMWALVSFDKVEAQCNIGGEAERRSCPFEFCPGPCSVAIEEECTFDFGEPQMLNGLDAARGHTIP